MKSTRGDNFVQQSLNIYSLLYSCQKCVEWEQYWCIRGFGDTERVDAAASP